MSEHAFSPRFFFQLTMAESSMLNRKCYIDRTTTRKILYWQDVPICKMLSHFLYFQFICLFLYSCLSNQHGLKFSTLPPRLFSSFFFFRESGQAQGLSAYFPSYQLKPSVIDLCVRLLTNDNSVHQLGSNVKHHPFEFS